MKIQSLYSLLTVLSFAFLGWAAYAQAPQASTVTVQSPGWMWSDMTESDDASSYPGGCARIGGPGADGTYSFTGGGIEVHGTRGQTISAGGQSHRIGKLQISIDGKVRSVVSLEAPSDAADALLFSETDLTPGIHVVELEPLDGWAAIEYLKVIPGQAAVVDTAPPVKGRVAMVDSLANYSMVYAKSDHWDTDLKNAVFMNGDAARAVRSVDDREYLVYRCDGLCNFDIRIYTKCSYDVLRRTLQFSVSSDNGVTVQPVDYLVVTSYAGGIAGDWFGYELAPVHALPAGAKDLIIVINPETGNSWDPQIAQVGLSIAH